MSEGRPMPTGPSGPDAQPGPARPAVRRVSASTPPAQPAAAAGAPTTASLAASSGEHSPGAVRSGAFEAPAGHVTGALAAIVDDPGIELLVISGMSGAGRTTVGNVLEDMGWFVVDNLPSGLLGTMADLARHSQGAVARIAVAVDVRSRMFASDLPAELRALVDRGFSPKLLFLEAADDALVRRFENVRRPHPLQDGGTITDGIAREREMLLELRGLADLVIDTSDLNVHQLRAVVEKAFGESSAHRGPRVTVLSFGFKYGLPLDADMVLDMRFLPNPFWIPELRPQNGRDAPVRDYVLGQPGATAFVDAVERAVSVAMDGYVREQRHYLTIAVGCTGGKHRSVASAEELGRRLAAAGVDIRVTHRDLGRE